MRANTIQYDNNSGHQTSLCCLPFLIMDWDCNVLGLGPQYEAQLRTIGQVGNLAVAMISMYQPACFCVSMGDIHLLVLWYHLVKPRLRKGHELWSYSGRRNAFLFLLLGHLTVFDARRTRRINLEIFGDQFDKAVLDKGWISVSLYLKSLHFSLKLGPCL